MSDKIKQFLLLANDILLEETYKKVIMDIEENIQCIIDIGIGDEHGTKGMIYSVSDINSSNILVSPFKHSSGEI